MSRGRVDVKRIAEVAGVSTAAVSYALSGKPGVSEETRTRIRQVADDLGYRKNVHAQALRTGGTPFVGLVLRDLENPYSIEVIRGMQHAAARYGRTVVLGDSQGNADEELRQLERMADLGVQGLVVNPLDAPSVSRAWKRMAAGSRLIFLNTSRAAAHGRSTVTIDRAEAVRCALRHLVEAGSGRILGLVHPDRLFGDSERRRLIQSVSADLGADVELVEVPLDIDGIRDAARGALSSARSSPAERPVGVLADSDYHAYAIYDVCRELGLRVGRRVLVVGQDDLWTSRLLDPPLSTIAYGVRHLGDDLLELLVEEGAEAVHRRRETKLLVRGSTVPVPEDS